MLHLPFEALVFDLGGVLVVHDNERLYRRLADRCAAPDALDRIRAMANDRRIGTGGMTAADLHRALRWELGYGLDLDGFLADWSSHFTVDRAMLDMVQRLAQTHRVLLFSNTNAAHWQYLVRATDGALARFEAYLSYEIGDAKPSLDAFRTVAARAGIDPRRSLFIDDLGENVAAAMQVGFHCHVFAGQSGLERFLEQSAGNAAG